MEQNFDPRADPREPERLDEILALRYASAMANETSWEKIQRELSESNERLIPWHTLPPLFGILKLVAMRKQLRAKNLYDTESIDAPATTSTASTTTTPSTPRPPRLDARTADGTWNDLEDPKMGAVGRRFGRNVPLTDAVPNQATLLSPSPDARPSRL